MSKYRRYERYKDSGVEWIGEIPEEWEVTKLKRCFKVLNGKEIEIETDSALGINVYGSGGVFKKTEKYLFKDESVLFGRKGTIGKPIYVNEPFWTVDTMYYTKYKEDMIPKWFYYMLNIYPWEAYTTQTALPSIVGSEVENDVWAIPSYKEQYKIVNFLDKKTAEIDALIADKEKLIELLQEKRQAIISEAVTKGLNPNVRVKDSGIEWIGKIPEHWEVTKIKYLSNIRNVKASDSDNDKTYIGLESIESKTGKLLMNNNDEQQAVGETANIFRKGDVLFGKLRPYLAKCIVADFNGRCTSELLVLRTTSNMLPEYLYLFMLSPIFIDVVNSSTYGAKMPRASWNFIGNLKIPSPNIKEQEEIVEYLIKLINNMDDLISDISTQIQKLKEYRQSLISEAVTGKIDVRNYAVG